MSVRTLPLLKSCLPSILCCLATACASPGPQAGPALPKLGKARVFSSDTGVQVTIVPLASSPDDAMILVTGGRSTIRGIMMPATYQRRPTYDAYLTTYHGQPWTLVTGASGLPFVDLIQIYAPGTPHNNRNRQPGLRYDEAATTAAAAPGHIGKLEALMASQRDDHSLAAVRDFDRDSTQREEQEEIRSAREKAHEACAVPFVIDVAWDTFDDQIMQEYTIAGLCKPAFEALGTLCSKSPLAAEAIRGGVHRVRCHRVANGGGVTLVNGAIDIAVDFDASTSETTIRDLLLEHDSLRLQGKSVSELIDIDGTVMCVDANQKYLGRGPSATRSERAFHPIFYGSAEDFIRVGLQRRAIGADSFFDPRYINTNKGEFRGVDMQQYSDVSMSNPDKPCTLSCGTETIEFKHVPKETATRIIMEGKFRIFQPRWKPYKLARDRSGNYFYVDRAAAKESREFRVMTGPKGGMRLLKMTNIVSDSAGDIFVTVDGELKLLFEKTGSTWSTKKGDTELVNLPVDENQHLIYSQLGVYLGENFGTPCDVF